jgi:ketosteroid isomerase-like protein
MTGPQGRAKMGAEQRASGSQDAGAALDELYAGLSRGDIAAAQSCCTEDVRIWHSFDRTEIDLAEAKRGWEQFVAAFPERDFVDVRRTPIADGFVQQHLMVARTQAGARLAWPICIVVRMREERIARLDEYMDRASSYPVEDEHPKTPGLPPR